MPVFKKPFDNSPFYREGRWPDGYFKNGIDSYLVPISRSEKSRYNNAVVEMMVGEIEDVQVEPLFKQDTVKVQFIRNGKAGNVGWPGPNVELGKSGKISESPDYIHGLYESPMPGQQVLIGFVEGNIHDPIVIQKYPYKMNIKEEMTGAHFLPMTSKNIGPTDIVLGHFTGSYIALRGTLPLPAQIDIFSESAITIDAAVTIDLSCAGKYTEDVGDYESNSTTNHKFSSGQKFEVGAALIDLTSIGIVKINATPAVVINSGILPVAKLGDLTPTLLGGSPIAATGVDVLVP